MTHEEELSALKSTINSVWADTYPGAVDMQDLSALQCRIKNLAEDRACWVFNARVANNKLNELESLRNQEPYAWELPTIPPRIVLHPDFNANYGGTVKPLYAAPVLTTKDAK